MTPKMKNVPLPPDSSILGSESFFLKVYARKFVRFNTKPRKIAIKNVQMRQFANCTYFIYGTVTTKFDSNAVFIMQCLNLKSVSN